MTIAQAKKQRGAIIAALANMSVDGWSRSYRQDWKELEIELMIINRQLGLE